jgi:hypothetical protein
VSDGAWESFVEERGYFRSGGFAFLSFVHSAIAETVAVLFYLL